MSVVTYHDADGQALTKAEPEAIAQQAAPSGVPYRFIDDADIPEDREEREAWKPDFSKPDGYGR